MFLGTLYLKEIGLKFANMCTKCKHQFKKGSLKIANRCQSQDEQLPYQSQYIYEPVDSIASPTVNSPLNSPVSSTSRPTVCPQLDEWDNKDTCEGSEYSSSSSTVTVIPTEEKCDSLSTIIITTRKISESVYSSRIYLVSDNNSYNSEPLPNVGDGKDDETKDNDLFFGAVKILFFFYQVKQFTEVPVDNKHSLFASILQSIRNTIENLLKFDIVVYVDNTLEICPIFGLNSYYKQLLKVGFAELLIFLCLLVKVVWFGLKKYSFASESQKFHNRLNLCLIHLILLTYLIISSSLLKLVHCIHIYDASHVFVLAIDGHVQCYTAAQTVVWIYICCFSAPFAIAVYISTSLLRSDYITVTEFFLILFLPFLSFPYLLYYKCTCRNIRVDEDDAMRRQSEGLATSGETAVASTRPLPKEKSAIIDIVQGPFVNKCKKTSGWAVHVNWQAIIIARQVILIIIHTFVDDIILRVYLITLSLLLILLYHVYKKPYELKILNRLETSSLTLLLFLSIISIHSAESYGTETTTNIKRLESTFQSIRFVILLLPVALLVWFWYVDKREEKKEK